MYHDFVHDPVDFEKNNVLYHYPVNHDRLVNGKFCSIACGAKFLFTCYWFFIFNKGDQKPYPPDIIQAE